MRSLTVIAEMGSGGAESVADQLARAALARGDSPTVASAGGWRAEALAADGVATVHVPLADPGPASQLVAARLLRRVLSGGAVDVVHAHNVRASVAARLACVRLRGAPPVISTVHGLAGGRYRRAAQVLARCADLVVAVSDDVAGRLSAAGLAADRLRVIENAPAPVPLVDRDLARRELDLPGGAPVVLCLARLSPPKRQDLLIRAWADVPEPAVLLIAGEGPLRKSLERQVRASPVRDRVRFLGDRRDVGRLLSASDALVLPTDREGLPMTVLEAMTAGVPVIASDVGGLRAIDPAAALLVPPASVAFLARAVSTTLAEPDERARRVSAARALVQTRFSSMAMAAAYFAAYEELRRRKLRADP